MWRPPARPSASSCREPVPCRAVRCGRWKDTGNDIEDNVIFMVLIWTLVADEQKRLGGRFKHSALFAFLLGFDNGVREAGPGGKR